MPEITTYASFRQFILDLIASQENKYNGDLEEYLRSLWVEINKHREEKPTLSLFGTLFEDSFSTPPTPFEDAWFRFTEQGMEIEDPYEGTPIVLDDFEYLKTTILFEIADLRRMAENNTLNNPYRYYGVKSPTGHWWYNFHPFDFLERGTAPMDEDDEEYTLSSSNWKSLAGILIWGAFYE